MGSNKVANLKDQRHKLHTFVIFLKADRLELFIFVSADNRPQQHSKCWIGGFLAKKASAGVSLGDFAL